MSNCLYCGAKAGFLKKYHPACKEKHTKGSAEMVLVATEAALSGIGLEVLETRLKSIADSNFITPSSVRDVLIQGWEGALNRTLEDSVLSDEEEARLMTFANKFQLSQVELNTNGAFLRAAMNSVLREVLHGNVPSKMNVVGQLPFNFQKSESLVWLFTRGPY